MPILASEALLREKVLITSDSKSNTILSGKFGMSYLVEIFKLHVHTPLGIFTKGTSVRIYQSMTIIRSLKSQPYKQNVNLVHDFNDSTGLGIT